MENAKHYLNQMMEEVYNKIKTSLTKNTSDITLTHSLVKTKADDTMVLEIAQKVGFIIRSLSKKNPLKNYGKSSMK